MAPALEESRLPEEQQALALGSTVCTCSAGELVDRRDGTPDTDSIRGGSQSRGCLRPPLRAADTDRLELASHPHLPAPDACSDRTASASASGS